MLCAKTEKKESVDEINSAVVFMYHRFGNSKYPSTNIRLDQFEKHLEYIEKNNYTVWPLSKIMRFILEGKKLPKKTVALTMDDAYITVYTNAYPMLKDKNFPFSVFVNTNAIDAGSKSYVSWEQMLEMSRHGGEFANHSLTHAYLLQKSSETKKEWQRRVKKEIEGAQESLQNKLGYNANENPKIFSYPFGEYDKNVMKLLQELNYLGVTQTSGVLNSNTNLREIPRFAMAEVYADIDDFSVKINSLPLPVESESPDNTILRTNKAPKLYIKLHKAIENVQCYSANGEKIQMQWISDQELIIQSKGPLNTPRDRYTCTSPAKDGRWYWYSKLWIVQENF